MATERKLQEFLGQSLEGKDFPAVMVDGTRMGDHVLVVLLGIDVSGRKHVLGLREGTTVNEEVCKSLFSDCIARGLKVERARLFVIDGGKGPAQSDPFRFRQLGADSEMPIGIKV